MESQRKKLLSIYNYRSSLLDLLSNYNIEHLNYVGHNYSYIYIGIYTFQRSSYNMESQRKKLIDQVLHLYRTSYNYVVLIA